MAVKPLKRKLIPMSDEEFDKNINKQTWTFAKTYAKTYPHEYFLRTENPDLFWELKRRIKELGVNKKFFDTDERYYFYKDYKYWGYAIIMNRTNDKTDYSSKSAAKGKQ